MWPRIGSRHVAGAASYYGELARFDDAAALRKALMTQSDEERACAQLLAVSRIVRTKYILIRAGMLAGGLAASLAAIVAVESS